MDDMSEKMSGVEMAPPVHHLSLITCSLHDARVAPASSRSLSSMNVTQLQQPPLQSVPPRSASEAEDITPDVCCLPAARNCYTHAPLAVLVDKTS